MKATLLLLFLLSPFTGKGQQPFLPGEEIPWQEGDAFWKELFSNPEYRQYYQDHNPGKATEDAWDYARGMGIKPENKEDFLQEVAEDITDRLLEAFGEEVLNDLLEEVGIARYLDKVYEQVLKVTLPKPGGIPVVDMGMEPAIKKGNTPHNLKTMLRLAVEKWLNYQWKKQVEGIYSIQREDLEYQKKAGPIALLKMASLDYEHFLSLEIMLPEQVLNYAAQVQRIYQSAEESHEKGKLLYQEFQLTSTQWEIPTQIEKLQLLETSRRLAKAGSWEMINQRRKALALAYLQLAERAQEKGEDLQQALKEEGHLKMSDGDRLHAQQLVNSYMEDYFRFKEKASLLLKASLENAGQEQKEVSWLIYQKSLRLKNLAP